MEYWVGIGIILVIILPFITDRQPRAATFILALYCGLSFVYFDSCVPYIMQHQTLSVRYLWFPDFNVNLSFTLDGLSLLFSLLITGVGTAVFIYAGGYLNHHPMRGRCYSYLLLFMLAMLGVVLSDNLFIFFMCWELTTICSYLLISLNHEKPQALAAAKQGLLITAIGGLALLVGVILIVDVMGTANISLIMQHPWELEHSSMFTPIMVLFLLAAFTKSAQFPFHFWLPNAMEAPTPVSAYLHSATMVKAGVYLLARFHVLFLVNPLWFPVLTIFGAVTMITGSILALHQTDLKRILAYSTIVAIGSLVFLLGSDNVLAAKAFVTFLLAHALYKAALFMAVGSIDHEVGTRQLEHLSGLWRSMPMTFIVILLAGASMAGLPPLIGFFGKELVYEAKLARAGSIVDILVVTAVACNMILAMLSLLIIAKPFFGEKLQRTIHESPWSLWFPPLVLVLLSLILGMLPFLFDQTIISPAALSIINIPISNQMSHWHGFTPAFNLSLLTMTGAVLLYFFRAQVYRLLNVLQFFFSYGPEFFYRHLLDGIIKAATYLTQKWQNGRLHFYILIFFCITLLLGSATLLPAWSEQYHQIRIDFSNISLLFLVLNLLVLLPLLMLVAARSLFISLLWFSIIGIGMIFIFLYCGALDVAMTQLLCEGLLLAFFILLFRKMPYMIEHMAQNIFHKMLRLVLSVGLGLLVTGILILISCQPFPTQLNQYFNLSSLPLGHGRNIVNVILVDFRGLDTFGEILVVLAASVGIYRMVKLCR